MASVFSIVLLLAAADGEAPIVSLAIAPGGQHVLAGSQQGIEVLELPELTRVQSLATKLEHIHDIAFSPTGKELAAAGGSPGERGAIEIWEWPAATLKLSLAAGDDVAYDLAWNAAGTELAVAGGDRTVRVIAEREGSDGTLNVTTLRPHSAAATAVVWLHADDLLLSASVDQTIRVLQPAGGKTLRSLDNHTGAVRDLTVRPGTHAGPTVVASAGADRTVRFWQPEIGRMVRFTRLPTAPTALCWTLNGKHVLAACEDGCARAIDYETLTITEVSERLDGWDYAVTPLPGGQTALVAGARGRLRIVRLNAINP